MQLECFCRFSLSPRGDGNTCMPGPLTRISDFLYPREGTETRLACSCCLARNMIFFIPARGRKRELFNIRSQGAQIFFIPARGRKHDDVPSHAQKTCGFSLSPRGDGNSLKRGLSQKSQRFSLSPRGDGNVYQPLLVNQCSGFSLYPRGDGNAIRSLSLPSPLNPDFLYPREGTETMPILTMMLVGS